MAEYPEKNVVHGAGMMASAMNGLSNAGAAIFAAGVSNSKETRIEEYEREKKTLYWFMENNKDKTLIYFSSYAAEQGGSPYAIHKREIEKTIRKKVKDYIIVRLPQVAGRTNNSSTLLKFLIHSACKKQRITLQRYSYRNLIDVCDVARVVGCFLDKGIKREIIPVGPIRPISIFDIVEKVEQIIQRKIKFEIVDCGDYQCADLARAKEILTKQDPIFAEGYQYLVMKKYIPVLLRDENEN